jgi:hypothetical protein
MVKKKNEAKKKKMGPEARLLSVYANKVDAALMQKRAKELRLSLSKYLCLVAERERNSGKPFVIGGGDPSQ